MNGDHQDHEEAQDEQSHQEIQGYIQHWVEVKLAFLERGMTDV